jgi:hypothetical protein
MPPRDLHLQDLAERLAQKQAELEAARRAYDARLADLAARKTELEAQLRAVDAEIQAVGKTVPAPAAVAAAPPKPAAASAEPPSLPRLLVALVRDAGGPITVGELTEKVRGARFPTTSGNLSKMVGNKVGELVKKGLLRRAAGQRGVVLPASGARAPAAKAASDGKGGGGAAAAPRAATPARPAGKRAAGSLRELLLKLLARSTRPMKAKELAEQVLASGYQTQSKDFVNVIWVALGKMDELENVKGQGYRLKRGAARAK